MPKTSQFRGMPSAEIVAEGMNRAIKNAARLSQDATLLSEQGSAPSAVALAILSIEESGKLRVLRQMILATSDKEVQALWRDYRSHKKKNIMWPFGDLVVKGARQLEDFRPLVFPGADHPDMLDELKQLCLYTDCFNGAKWSSPTEIDITNLASYLLKMADILSRPRNFTAEELFLWRKHLLPVKDAPFEAQKSAVAAWFQEMKLRGLSDASPESVEAFLGPASAPTQA